MILALFCIPVIFVVVFVLWPKKRKGYDYLAELIEKEDKIKRGVEEQAVDLKSLTDRDFKDRVQIAWKNFIKQLGQFAYIKIIALVCLLAFIGHYFNKNFLRGDELSVVIFFVGIGSVFFVRWMQVRQRKLFEQNFPDALNMMTSAVSAGESITHAIMYVGNTLDGDVGKEFKIMAQRMQLGENIDDVFRKATERFPYPSFYFFVICLRANIQRGGQLKDIMQRLNRMMFNARSVEKKTLSMTAEARTSVKIVAAIPFFFLVLLQYLSPQNFDFVMFNSHGRPILYYVLVSEAIGVAIIWLLMKGVR